MNKLTSIESPAKPLIPSRLLVSSRLMLMRPDGTLLTLEEIQDAAIDHAMCVLPGRPGQVARALGIGRSTLYRHLMALGYRSKEHEKMPEYQIVAHHKTGIRFAQLPSGKFVPNQGNMLTDPSKWTDEDIAKNFEDFKKRRGW